MAGPRGEEDGLEDRWQAWAGRAKEYHLQLAGVPKGAHGRFTGRGKAPRFKIKQVGARTDAAEPMARHEAAWLRLKRRLGEWARFVHMPGHEDVERAAAVLRAHAAYSRRGAPRAGPGHLGGAAQGVPVYRSGPHVLLAYGG